MTFLQVGILKQIHSHPELDRLLYPKSHHPEDPTTRQKDSSTDLRTDTSERKRIEVPKYADPVLHSDPLEVVFHCSADLRFRLLEMILLAPTRLDSPDFGSWPYLPH